MFFSMIKLRQGIYPHDISHLARQSGYQTHQRIWNLFSDTPDRKRDFIYRHETSDGWPTFYTVSHRKPMNLHGIWEIALKKYNPILRPGQRLGFALRANPIRSRRDENAKQKRHDVVMEEKLKLKREGKKLELPDIVQKQGLGWLQERAESYGFSISANNVRVDGYQQHKLFKRNNIPIMFSTLDFNGILTVTEPDVFITKCLYTGFGPAKGFGCGLMLVRRI
ncbi:MAG: type I-E CRISPR-associated protein Cas6/Cse3/CasE [Deltaproteobacteria bacterium]|jgi:CRISPR system Cascade subunit CasE|nr:type I-E CRISPR-associated protein Cas6/Cse3/CasE [Deltaproteobacteria bacterium]